MKRFAALVVAVGSFLAAPIALADSAPQSGLPPKGTTPKTALRDDEFYKPSPEAASDTPRGMLGGSESGEPSPDTWSLVNGSWEGTDPQDVKTSFEDTDTGS
jgi:hypothetical protein